jgi:hypothetical protein
LGFIPGEFILVSVVEKVAQKQKFPKSFFSLSLRVINLLFPRIHQRSQRRDVPGMAAHCLILGLWVWGFFSDVAFGWLHNTKVKFICKILLVAYEKRSTIFCFF